MNKSAQLKKISIIGIFILLLFGVYFVGSSGGDNDKSSTLIERTPTSNTYLNLDGTLTLTLYSGTRYVYEDNIWKNIEEARSLKNSDIKLIFLENDSNFKIHIIDYNLTSIQVELESKQIGDIPIKIWELNNTKENYFQQDKSLKDKYKEIYDKKIDSLETFSLGSKKNKTYEFGINKILEFGYNSTTITLQDANTENLDDSDVNSWDPETNFGSIGSLWVGLTEPLYNKTRRAYIKFNISELESGDSILNANVSLYTDNPNSSSDINIYHVFSNNWNEETITWDNQPCGVNFNSSANCNLTATDSFPVSVENTRYEFDVKNSIQRDKNNESISFILKANNEIVYSPNQFLAKEYSLTEYRPILYVKISTSACLTNADCSSARFCHSSGECVPKMIDSSTCNGVTFNTSGVEEDSACYSGYCDNDDVGLSDDGWCFTPYDTYLDGQETTKCEYSTNLIVNTLSDERALGTNLITCNNSGQTYFQDEVSTNCLIADDNSICRSSGSLGGGDGCSADAGCNGITAGTGACSLTCVYDSTLPAINITSPLNNTNQTTKNVVINMTMSDASGLSMCRWSNNSGTINNTFTCGTNLTTINWLEGRNNVTIYVNDSANNWNSSSVSFFVDTTPPVTTATMTSPPGGSSYTNGTWTKNNIRIVLDSTDTGGVGIDNTAYPVYCTDTTNTCTPSTVFTTNIDIATNGTSYVRYSATDLLNNAETTKSQTLKIDKINPSLVIDSPTNATKTTDTTLDILYIANDTYSGLNTCQWSKNGGTTNTTITCGTNLTSTTWDEGNTTVWIYVNDSVNNLNSTAIFFTLDTISPTISISSPTNNTNTTDITLDILYNANDTNRDACWWTNNTGKTNVTLTNCANITTYTWLEGRNNITIYVNDTLNHLSSASVSFVLDTVKPSVNITSPTNNTNTTDLGIDINITILDTNLQTCQWTNDTGKTNNTFTCGTNLTTFTWLENRNNVTIYASDYAGNLNNTQSISFLVDTINPLINYTENTPVNYANLSQNSTYVNVSFTEANFQNITFLLFNTSSVNKTTFTTATYNINWTNLGDGNYTYNVTICDVVNHCNTTSIRYITLDKTNPTATLNTPINNTNTTTTSQNLTVNLTDNLGIKSANLSISNSTNNTIYSQITNFAGNVRDYTLGIIYTFGEGVWKWMFQTEDYAGNKNTTRNNTINVDLTAPSINITSPLESETFPYVNITITWTTSDALTGLQSCWYTNDSGVTNNTIACGQTTVQNLTSGTFTYVFYAKDYVNYESNDSVTFVISTTGPAITLKTPSDNTWLNYKNNINFSFNATDSNGVDTCILYGNWSGTFTTNYTWIGHNSGRINSTLLNLNDNQSIWNVKCNDTVNNIGWASTNFTTKIDSIKPVVSFNVAPTNNSNSTATNIYVNISVTEINENYSIFALYNDVGSYNVTTFSPGTRSINWTNLPDANYTYNVTISDYAGNVNFTETRRIRLDDTAPTSTILFPQAQNYGTNSSMSLNHTTTDNLIGLSYCRYNVINSTGSVIIPSTILSSCENTTFGLPGGDIDYTLTLWAYDILNNVQSSSVTFGIRTNSPAVTLFPTNDTQRNYVNNHLFNVSVTTNADSMNTCQLWGNFNGTWGLNQSKTSISETVSNQFIGIYLNESEYLWNVWCNDSLNNQGWGLNNQTYIVDLTYPNITLSSPTTTVGSQTISFTSVEQDIHTMTCKYSIYNSLGNIDGLSNNVSFTCNVVGSATTTAYGNFNLTIYAIDKAGNENSTSQLFTTSASSGTTTGGGGGGETIKEVSVTTIKQLEGTNLSALFRAIIFARTHEICTQKIGSCLLSPEQKTKLYNNITKQGVSIKPENLDKWINAYNNQQLESVKIKEDSVKTYHLFEGVVVIKGLGFIISPSRLDPFYPFIISDKPRFEYLIKSTKELKSASLVSGELGISVELSKIDNSTAKVILEPKNLDWSFKIFKGIISYIDVDGNTVFQEVYFRPVNWLYTIWGVIPLWIFSIIIMFGGGSLIYVSRRKIIKLGKYIGRGVKNVFR